MIDFTATSETLDLQIEFVNYKGETVKTYSITELEQFVIDKQLNITRSMQLVSGSGIPSDPNNVEEEIEIEQPLSDYIDENWQSVTEKFYMDRNPTEFKSGNRTQETIRRVR